MTKKFCKWMALCWIFCYPNFVNGSNANDDFTYDTTVVFGTRRFRVSKNMLNYSLAEQHCENDNSILAVIDSKELAQTIKLALENSERHKGATVLEVSLTDQSIWIGLQLNVQNRSAGKWSNGEIYDSSSSFHNWAESEPQTDECVQLWKASFWMWDDTYCDLERYFICEDQDPQSYSTSQVEKTKQAILELAQHDVTTGADLNFLSHEVNALLDVARDEQFTPGSQNISTRDILLAIETITSNYNASRNSYVVNRQNIAIDVRDILSPNDSVTLGVVQQDNETNSPSSSIFLSYALLDEARKKSQNEAIQINSVLYRKSYFFRSETDNENVTSLFGEGPVRQIRSSVLGDVIAVDLSNIVMKNLDSPVVINHVIPLSDAALGERNFSNYFSSDASEGTQSPEKYATETIRTDSSIRCVFWDFSMNQNSGGWSEEGCRLFEISASDGMLNTTCLCDHMTNFGILLDTAEYYEPEYLTYVTIVGCIVSLTCLLCTLIIHLYFRNLRTQVSKKILIHICIGLILLNGFFLLGIDRTYQPEFCFAMTIILHYVLLLSWAWMLVMGIFLFRTFALYKAGSETGPCFLWTATILSYVIPGIVVAVIVSVFHNSYQSERYCWLSGDILLFSIVIPVAVVLLINITVFLVVMWKIKSTAKSQRFQKRLDLKKLIQTLRRAIFMTLVLGLPWIFGYVMLLIKDDFLKNIFAVIFTVCNALQGVGILFLYCVRQEDVRDYYKSTVKRFRRSLVRTTRAGYRKTAPSETMNQTNKDNLKKKSTSTEYTLSALSPSYYHVHSTFDTDSNHSEELITVRSPVPLPRQSKLDDQA